MAAQWDIAIYDRHKHLQLVGEVKTKVGTSPEWAARFRDNILEHEQMTIPEYFLLAFPDQFYLWKDASNTESVEPYTIDVHTIFQPYFERLGGQDNRLSHDSFELLVASWLGEVIHAPNFDEAPVETATQWLIDSGLYQATEGGSVECEVVA